MQLRSGAVLPPAPREVLRSFALLNARLEEITRTLQERADEQREQAQQQAEFDEQSQSHASEPPLSAGGAAARAIPSGVNVAAVISSFGAGGVAEPSPQSYAPSPQNADGSGDGGGLGGGWGSGGAGGDVPTDGWDGVESGGGLSHKSGGGLAAPRASSVRSGVSGLQAALRQQHQQQQQQQSSAASHGSHSHASSAKPPRPQLPAARQHPTPPPPQQQPPLAPAREPQHGRESPVMSELQPLKMMVLAAAGGAGGTGGAHDELSSAVSLCSSHQSLAYSAADSNGAPSSINGFR